MYQKIREHNFCKKGALICHNCHVAMAHRNYFRRNNLRILKLAYTKIEDSDYSMFACIEPKLFRLEKICQMFIFYLSTSEHQVLHLHNCKENEDNFCCQFDDTIEVHGPLME